MKTLIYFYFAAMALMLSSINVYSVNIENGNNSSSGDFFIQNRGQIVDFEGKPQNDVLYYSTNGAYGVFIRQNSISFVTHSENYKNLNAIQTLNNKNHPHLLQEDTSTIEINRHDMKFLNTSLALSVNSLEPETAKFNFYLAQCPEGITDVATCKTIVIKNLYDNIDLELSQQQSLLHFKFKIGQGADLNSINAIFEGAGNSSDLDQQFKEYFSEQKKYSNSIIEGNIQIIGNKLEFIPSGQDNYPQIMSPSELIYSTYFGATPDQGIFEDVMINDIGNFIICGQSAGFSFPTTNGVFQKDHKGGSDMIVFLFDHKFNVIWGTYFGGSNDEQGLSCVFDKKGNIWVGGESRSKDFPVTSNAFQKSFASIDTMDWDGALIKLSDDGKRLYSTYFGGSELDWIFNFKVDHENSIIGSGFTDDSTLFPITNNAYNKNLSTRGTGFIFKMDETGKLLLCSLFGGSHYEANTTLTLLSDDYSVVCGNSDSSNLECPNGYQKLNAGGGDGYISKLDSTGKPVWGTYLGGKDREIATYITSDQNDNIIISGMTNSIDFPVDSQAYQKQNNGTYDLFLSKFDKEGNLLWSTYIGGNKDEIDSKISCDKYDNIVVTASTTSSDYPVTDKAFQKTFNGIMDITISVFNSDCKLLYSTYFGGSDVDGWCSAIQLNYDTIVCVGGTASNDFPVTDNAYQKYFKGGRTNAYITELKMGLGNPCLKDTFNYDNFITSKNLNLVNNAVSLNNKIQLTGSSLQKVGAVWYANPVPVNCDFYVNFTFQFKDGSNGSTTENSLPGADGIAFVVQFDNDRACGGDGGGIGYDGIPNSLAVEYDTYQNDSTQIINLNDPNGNHVAVQTRGTLPNSSKHDSSTTLGINPNILTIKSDGTIYYSKIEYNLTDKKLSIYLDTTSNFLAPVLTIDNLDLSKTLDLYNGSCAYIGFTSATGKAYETHNLLSWAYNNNLNQPSSVATLRQAQGENITVFPNPASEKISIKFYIGQPANISLKISDIIGNQITIIDNQFMESGSHSFEWDASRYPAGIYYYLLRAGSDVNTGKIVVLK